MLDSCTRLNTAHESDHDRSLLAAASPCETCAGGKIGRIVQADPVAEVLGLLQLRCKQHSPVVACGEMLWCTLLQNWHCAQAFSIPTPTGDSCSSQKQSFPPWVWEAFRGRKVESFPAEVGQVGISWRHLLGRRLQTNPAYLIDFGAEKHGLEGRWDHFQVKDPLCKRPNHAPVDRHPSMLPDLFSCRGPPASGTRRRSSSASTA